MSRNIRPWWWLLSVAVSAVVTAQSELAQRAAPLYELEQQIRSEVLENGLQLRILPLPAGQTVSIASQFAVGSRNEGPGQTGYAHIFEHMLFKGSENAPGDTYVQTIGAYAGRFNATTWFDATNYYLTLPSEAVELGLWLEADRFIRPTLTEEGVQNQQGAVLEEMAMTIDNQPYVRPAMEFLLDQVAGTPYGHAVIGSVEDVSGSSAASLSAFHQAFYRPDLMQLSLVGDVPEPALAWVEQAFGAWSRPNHAPPEFGQLMLERRAVHQRLVDKRGPWPGLVLGWHTVGSTHPDAAAVALLELYLLHSKASVVQQSRLTDPDQLLTFSLPVSMELHGVANLVLVPRARTSLDSLADSVAAHIDAVAQAPLDAQTLTRLKTMWLEQQLARLDSPRSLAIALSATLDMDAETPLTGPWQRIEQVTPQDIARVARDYFQAGTVRLDLLPPWYVRAVKRVLEWLPSSTADWLEEAVL
ncbi:pitrilysin family protein [Ferrimonas pelagia]|uniref:Pitrilysin family protein n=1 Tax=Ferrimonas pelagia TaxID=1177826 RepID=A0ABP9FD07_9GAMM